MHPNNTNRIRLPNYLRKYREKAIFPQRKVAAYLDIDTATYCKIENGKYFPSEEQIGKISLILRCDSKELIKIWLADKIVQVAEEGEDVAFEALQIANQSFEVISNE